MGLFGKNAFPTMLNIEDRNMQFIGKSQFNIAFIKPYELAFYVAEKPKKETDIFKANFVKLIRLKLTTSMVTTDLFIKFMLDMYKNTAGNKLENHRSTLDDLLKAIKKEGARNEDIFDIFYDGVGNFLLIKNGKTIEKEADSNEFSQISFGIWLGDNCINKKMKKELLKEVC